MISGFDFSVITRSLPFLLEGLALSLGLTAVAMIGGILIGFVLAVMRMSKRRVPSFLAAAYINGFRAVPLILVIFWFYFLIPLLVGRPIDALHAAIVAFTMFEAAYYAEIIRAGISSVSPGQWQAGAAAGLRPAQTLRLVVLPQAARQMLPLILTQAVILFQDTSLVYVISLRDFMTSASIVANRDNRLVEIYVFAAIVYFCLCTAGAAAATALQKRSAMP